MLKPEQRADAIAQQLQTAYHPSHLEVIDDSHQHAGHGSAEGKGHFTVIIEAEAFRGQAPITRHRMVFATLDALIQTDIHALTIQASAPK